MNFRRRLLIAAGLAAPLSSLAQMRDPPIRIGWLSFGRSMGGGKAITAFRAGLRDLGYAEGRDIEIIERVSGTDIAESDRLAAELLLMNPHVVVTLAAAVMSVIRAGVTVPVAFAFSGDPVAAKIVRSFARPGGNLTGMSFLSLELVGKRMELVKEVLPSLKRIAIIANPQHAGRQAELVASQQAAGKLGLALDYFEARNALELNAAFDGIAKARSGAVVVFPDAVTMSFSERIAAFGLQQRVLTMSGWEHFVEQGNLMSYGPNMEASFRRLASYVDRILKGVRPADLPVELPSVVEMVVNLSAAKALRLTIPQTVLLRTDRVIE